MRQRKLYEQIEEILSTEIAEGLHKPGDPLPSERLLMERFGVGRPSIREALFSLSKRGMIELGSGRRPRVLEMSFDIVLHELDLIVRQVLNNKSNIFHLMELRRIIECALARKLAADITNDQIDELKKKLEANGEARGHLSRFWKTDSDFHSAIAQMNGNPVLPPIVDAILNWLIENRRVTLPGFGREQAAFEHHTLIFEAISSRNPDLAEKAMKEHLLAVEQRVATQLQQNNTPA